MNEKTVPLQSMLTDIPNCSNMAKDVNFLTSLEFSLSAGCPYFTVRTIRFKHGITL